MLKFYQKNLLSVSNFSEYGVFVDGGEYGPLPLRDASEHLRIGDEVNAFVYRDVSDQVAATMSEPYAEVGECAYLEVVSINDLGAFLYWGMPKDLLLPYSQQIGKVRKGNFCAVYLFQDQSERPIATMKFHNFLEEGQGDLTPGQQVDLMIIDETDLGFKAAINNKQLGLIYHEELSQPLSIGMKIKGWVKKIRDDGKVNLNINALDNESRDNLEEQILEELRRAGGRLNLSDKSHAEDIYSAFKVSKKNFKRALGSLYKQHLISIAPDYIENLEQSNKP